MLVNQLTKLAKVRPTVRLAASFLLSAILLAYAVSPLPGNYLAASLILLLLYLNLVLVRLAQASLRVEAVEKAIQAERAACKRELALERAQRIAAFARRDSSGHLPERCLILLAVPRSGSTWLMDGLRCHPSVYLEPSAILFERLGLTGGRYPRGLSDGPDGVIDLELSTGRGARVPAFALPELGKASSTRGHRGPCAIEKIHPQFFDYDNDAFLARIDELEQDGGMTVDFVYQVRDPTAVLASFLNYQQRDPTWLPSVRERDLATYVERTYAAVSEIARRRKGLIVDYSDLIADFREVLLAIYRHLWPDAATSVLFDLATGARDVTSREKRGAALDTAFFGERPGPVRGREDEHLSFFERYRPQVAGCYESYHALLEMQ